MAPSLTPPPPDISSTLSSVRSALSSAQNVAQDHNFTYKAHALTIQTTDKPVDTPKASKSSKSSRSSKSRSHIRTSDTSEFGEFQHTPGSLTADLLHYKELYSKLRFSYLETVTKEKYLRAIIEGEDIYENHEIEEFENELGGRKQELRAMKEEMARLVEHIEIVAAKLGPESEAVNKTLEELERLPQELEELNTAIYAELPNQDTYDESLNLPLDQTLALVRDLELEISSINRNLTTLNSEIPRKQRMTEQFNKDLKPLEMEHEELVGQATQAREMREREQEMGRADRENMGRWYKATSEALNQLVGP